MSIEHKNAIKECKKFFCIEELCPPELVNSFPEDWLWNLFDTHLLLAVVWIRKKVGCAITINNWHAKGKRKYCGFRPSSCKEGAQLSGHRLGSSLDLHCKDLAGLQKACLECPYLTEIEAFDKTPTWAHISTRPHCETGIRIIKP